MIFDSAGNIKEAVSIKSAFTFYLALSAFTNTRCYNNNMHYYANVKKKKKCVCDFWGFHFDKIHFENHS